MNKYKKGFTPEEAALIAVGFERHSSLKAIEDDINALQNDSRALEKYFPADEQLHVNIEQKEDFIRSVVNELVIEARNIKDALSSEVLLAYENERGNTERTTTLKIYLTQFINSKNRTVCTLSTQLTKASLAKWFEEQDEEQKSEKFKSPTNLPRLNRFKDAYIAEHAALISVGLENYQTIDSAYDSLEYQDEQLIEAKRLAEFAGENMELDIDECLSVTVINRALDVKEALIEELELVIQWDLYYQQVMDLCELGIGPEEGKPSRETDIVILKKVMTDDSCIDFDRTLISKKSIAIWLWNNAEVDYAKNILPNIEAVIQDMIKSENTKSYDHTMNTEKKTARRIRTPESTLLDSLGLMAWLLSKKSNRFQNGEKPNASQIKKAVEDIVIGLDLNNDPDNQLMLSNLNKDIQLSLKQLESRFKL